VLQRITFSSEARSDLRAIDRETALRILKSLDRFLKTEAGDVKQLEGFDPPLFRLRIADWRLVFRKIEANVIEVIRVRNRGDVYR
jgi:mRNA interferase RelE/StbE